MDVKTITLLYLEANGFDGLRNDECGCKLDDLFPCDYAGTERCKPGYLVKDGTGEWDFLIVAEKPVATT